MANLSVEEPYALMRARTGLWEPWRVTARATRPGSIKPTAVLQTEACNAPRFDAQYMGLSSSQGRTSNPATVVV